jgi:hypothetical protein
MLNYLVKNRDAGDGGDNLAAPALCGHLPAKGAPMRSLGLALFDHGYLLA